MPLDDVPSRSVPSKSFVASITIWPFHASPRTASETRDHGTAMTTMPAAAACSTVPAVARSPSIETTDVSESGPPAVGDHHVVPSAEDGPRHRDPEAAGADDPDEFAIFFVHHGRSSYSDANR